MKKYTSPIITFVSTGHLMQDLPVNSPYNNEPIISSDEILARPNIFVEWDDEEEEDLKLPSILNLWD